MRVGAGDNFDLACIAQARVFGHNATDELLLLGIDALAIAQAKASFLVQPPLNIGVIVEHRIEPREIVPSQQVGVILIAPELQAPLTASVFPLTVQITIAAVGLNLGGVVGVEEPINNKFALQSRQSLNRLKQKLQVRIKGIALGIVVELKQQ